MLEKIKKIALCKITNKHFDKVNFKSILIMLKEEGLRFDTKAYEEAYSYVFKNLGIDPQKIYTCRRCGRTINGPEKFLSRYKQHLINKKRK